MTLETHLSWKEPYASVSLNRKDSGIMPPGVYRGFVVSPGGGMVLSVAPNAADYPRSVAIVDRDGYNFTVSTSETETFTVPGGTNGTYYLCLEAQYINGGGGTTSFVLLASAAVQTYHVVLAKIVIPVSTTTITEGMITSDGRTLPSGVQFDSSDMIATRSFVYRENGNFSGKRDISTNTTLTGDDAGKILRITASCTVTIPLASTVVDGTALYFINANAGVSYTLQRSGSDVIQTGTDLTSITVLGGDSIAIVRTSPSSWTVQSGSAQSKFSGLFASTLGTSGTQILPSGLIVKWGQTTSSSASATSVTFPAAFPTHCFSVIVNPITSSSHIANPDSIGVSGFSLNAYTYANAMVAIACNWVAIGD